MRQKYKSVKCKKRRYKSIKKIRHILEFIFLKSLFLIINRFPHRALFWTSATIGYLMFKIPSVKKITTSNVQASFRNKSKEEVKRIACSSLSNLVQNLFEFVWFSGETKRQEKHLSISVKTNEPAKEKTRNGKGLIFVAPHIGNWELAGLMSTSIFGLPFAAVAKKLDNPYLDKLIIQKRSAEGTRIIPSNGAVRGMIRALAKGSAVATLIDQNIRARDGGIWVEFFGLPVSSSRAPAMLARRLGYEVVLSGCIRIGRKYTIFTETLPKPILAYESDQELIQDLMIATENLVHKYPEQYLWLYKRYLHIPETANEITIDNFPFYAKKVAPHFYDERVPPQENFFK
tara:strand:+ start:1132 stop:2166 length:1035 start_codon:yes stop_codon:yes gene_type:complete